MRPFTLAICAREMAPAEAWSQRIFIQANYRISLLWALIATANSILGIAMHFSSRPLTMGVSSAHAADGLWVCGGRMVREARRGPTGPRRRGKVKHHGR